MHSLVYKVNTLSPVIITGNSDANLTETVDYITGPSILGVFAGKYIQSKKLGKAHEDELFYKWFLQGELAFNNAYPVVKGKNKDNIVYPTPYAIQVDKDGKTIINLINNETTEKTLPLGGYSSFNGNNILNHFPAKRLNFHYYKRDRIRRQGTETGIFNYESLEKGQEFVGQIIGTKENLQQFKQIFSDDQINAQIGKSRYAQYGQVAIELLGIQETESQYDLDEDEREVVITFISPVILVNQYGFPEVSLNILTKYLEDVLGQGSFEIDKSFLRMEKIENYLTVWQLKKPLARALKSGSTILIVFNNALDENMRNKLHNLFINGLGERTNEGFGRIMINWGIERKYVKGDLLAKEISKPETAPPVIIKEIFSLIVKKNIIEYIQSEAIRDANDFSWKALTTSIVGRLELMLKDAKTREEFISRINNLKDRAKRNLEHSRNKNETLLQALNDKKLDFENLLNSIDQYKNLTEIAEFDYQKDREFINQLYKEYWSSFFKYMRKLIKRGGAVIEANNLKG